MKYFPINPPIYANQLERDIYMLMRDWLHNWLINQLSFKKIAESKEPEINWSHMRIVRILSPDSLEAYDREHELMQRKKKSVKRK